MHLIAVVNLKGGCGKTTVSTNLAARFARLGHRPLLVDLDQPVPRVKKAMDEWKPLLAWVDEGVG